MKTSIIILTWTSKTLYDSINILNYFDEFSFGLKLVHYIINWIIILVLNEKHHSLSITDAHNIQNIITYFFRDKSMLFFLLFILVMICHFFRRVLFFTLIDFIYQNIKIFRLMRNLLNFLIFWSSFYLYSAKSDFT